MPQKAANLIINSLRTSSKKQYSVYVTKFLMFISKPLQNCDVTDLIKFIECIYSKGCGYSACNTARSAVSTLFSLLFNKPMGQHYLVSRLLKGIFNSRPSLPRYSRIWDPDILLKSLDFDSSKSTLLGLSQKLVTLLTLLSSQRVATIAGIQVTDVCWDDKYVSIHIQDTIKQSRPGAHQAPLSFQKFHNRNLCVYSLLQLYLDKTKGIRGNIGDLWLTTTLPTRKTSKQTLSNWIRLCLERAGLQKFGPHSLRAASASKAAMKKVPLDHILKAGGWSSDSVFARFYDLPIATANCIAHALL